MARARARSSFSEAALRRLVPEVVIEISDDEDNERYVATAPRGCHFASGPHRLVASAVDGRGIARDHLAALLLGDPVVSCPVGGCRHCLCICDPARPDDLCAACMGIKEL